MKNTQKSTASTTIIKWGLGTLAAAAWGAAPSWAKDPKIAGPVSFVRVLNAVDGGPKVDFYIDGQRKLNDFKLGGISAYLRLPAGRHTFTVRSNNPSRVLVSGARTFGSNQFVTVGAYGSSRRPRLLAFNDSSGPVAFGKARLTAFHLSPGTPAVDVIGTTGTGRTYRLFSRLRYGQIRAAYVPAVPMTIRLRSNGVTLKTLEGIEPRAGRKYAAYAIGRAGRDFQVLLDVTASQ